MYMYMVIYVQWWIGELIEITVHNFFTLKGDNFNFDSEVVCCTFSLRIYALQLRVRELLNCVFSAD